MNLCLALYMCAHSPIRLLSPLDLVPPRFGPGCGAPRLRGNKDTVLRFPAGPAYGSCSLISCRWIHPKAISYRRLIWQTRQGRWRELSSICVGEIDVNGSLRRVLRLNRQKAQATRHRMRCRPFVIYCQTHVIISPWGDAGDLLL